MPAWAQPAESPLPTSSLRIPEPDLSVLEPQVAEQMAEMRELAEALVSANMASTADKVKALADMGKLYHAYGLLEAADLCYAQAAELDPSAVDWSYLRGHVALGRGDLDLAADLLARALELDPDDLPALVYLAEVEAERNRAERADELLHRASEIAPSDPAVRAALGERALAAGDHEEAVRQLSAVLEALPQVTRLHHPLGLAYRGLGDLERARHHLALRGEVGVKVADPRLDELDGLRVGERVHLLRGKRAYQAGDMVAAVEQFRGAVEAQPESSRARVNLAAALVGLGEVNAALRELELAVALEPGNATAHFNLAELLAAGGEPRLAIPHYLAAIEAAPDDEEAWLGEARSWIALGDFAKAVLRLERASAANPTSGRIAYALARLTAAAPDLTVRDGVRALELAQRVFEARRSAGNAILVALALRESGRCADARTFLDGLIEKSGELDAEGQAALLDQRAAIGQGSSCRP